ncbi:flagellar hook-length control protein FliK, partial [Paraherbaspirillum soli]
SAHQSVRDAVEAALPQLRSTLADSGISLGNTSVSADTQQQQQQSAFAQQASGQSGSRGGQQRGDGLANFSGGVERSVAPVVSRGVLGVVDTFA